MSRQSRTMSLVESVTNVAVGYGVAVGAQMVVFPLFRIAVSLRDNLLIGLVFTAVSIVRSFALRRLFEAIRIRQPLLARTGPKVRVSLTFEDSLSEYLMAINRRIDELDAERSRLVHEVASKTAPVKQAKGDGHDPRFIQAK